MRGARVAARRAADAQVDAPGIERLEHAEALGGAERAVVGQQHAAGAHPQAFRLGAEPRQQDLGARVGERRNRVMLGQPIAVVAQLFDAAGEGERFRDRPAGALAMDDRRLV
jgi:hypothetical protein